MTDPKVKILLINDISLKFINYQNFINQDRIYHY